LIEGCGGGESGCGACTSAEEARVAGASSIEASPRASSGHKIARAEAASAPLVSPILALLREVYEKFLSDREGAVATYIPELAKVDPEPFGIAIVTADGHVYDVGASRAGFTVQSISKPIVYGLALEDHGRDHVLARIGVEPSGDPFNAIMFDERNNRPFNPMGNAGAIVATALVRGEGGPQRMERILDIFRAFCGRALEIDEAAYLSEKATGHRNRAIAYLELNNGMIAGDADLHLDLYFRQCAIRATALDLAFMGATLANDGVHPTTGERALASAHIRDVMSVMATCGMYDYAGEWELRVGLPAKSGVGGGIVAVLPGQLGIGVYSPRLDDRGNSRRGIRVCEELSSRLKLHLLDHRGTARSPIRRAYRGSDIRSKRVRNAPTDRMLDQLGASVYVFELHGHLYFGNTEQVIRRILRDDAARHIVLDFGRVAATDHVAVDLLRDLAARIAASGRVVLFAAATAELRELLGRDVAFAPDVDAALERCEDAVLRRAFPGPTGLSAPVENYDFPLLAGLDPRERAILDEHLIERSYDAGETIIREGSAADSLYFLLSGSVDVWVGGAGAGAMIRLARIDAGNVFGELALLGTGPRTADVVAATRVSVLLLDPAGIADLAARHAAIHTKLVAAVACSLSERLRRANAAIRALTR
jgi:glutaminase